MAKLTVKEVQELFKDQDICEKAVEQAKENRDQEIGLLKERSDSALKILIGGVGIYTAMLKLLPTMLFLHLGVSSLLFLLCFNWYLGNRGSKYWQNHWERLLDVLEDPVWGPTYKVAPNPEHFSFKEVIKEYPVSVSKIRQFDTLLIATVWFGVFCWEVSKFAMSIPLLESKISLIIQTLPISLDVVSILFLVGILLFTILMPFIIVKYARSNFSHEVKDEDIFILREIEVLKTEAQNKVEKENKVNIPVTQQ